MATYNTQSIKVPIETQLQVKNTIEGIKRLRAELEKQFEKVDPASSLGKSLAKLRTKIDQGFANIDASNLGSELFDEGDFKKVLGYVNQINQQLQQMRVQGTTATAKALGIDTQEIEEATKKLHELKEEYKQFKNRSVEKDNPAELARFEQHKKATGFNAKQSYQRNIDRLTAAEQRAKNDFEALNTEESKAARAAAESKFKEAERLANEAKTEYSKAADALKDAKTEQSKQEQAQIDYNVAQRLKGVNTHTSSKRKKTDIIADYQNIIGSNIATKGGNFQRGGKEFARTIATWLNMSEGEIETLLGNKADVIATQLNEKLNAAMTKNMRPFVSKVEAANTGYSDEELTKARAAVTEAQNKEAAARVNLDAKEAALTTAESEHNKAVETFNKAEALLKEISEQIELLKSLQKQLEEAADAEYGSKIKDAEKAQETAQQESTKETREQQTSTSMVVAEEAKKLNQIYQETRQGNQDTKNAEAEAERTRRELEAQIAADNRRSQQEAEQFKQNLQHTINQWMSAQQVINLVKDGIRQAYQDIQGLDAAMTNIAVVTDMSVSDLWGKINEYMSIAQQYGVTTQGVYEVSQLYYQQGLSTNEVMAATTETLKMARIAGMGYAEAADAMTVAIRAFKMEMGDAGHVTDVYSKVAAVTASDTEELAIAMSKTASSAESVGSSFENTTAMLAVMVETTRESAQNLGSALKSIISRYGEMKQGLTQDSDGEIIDYNKTDAALRSIGISIKDAQGQFRDFDDVIFELSSKWDNLDKNTQRYIATIMAGNRQQSRFIALVDNWERLDEVANAAQDSEDAGLLQYAKTLDSLDTKINNLKTSFQEFYMNIINGPLISGALEALNDLIQGFNKLGSLQGIFNLVGIIRGLKTGLKLIVNTFGSSFTNIITSWKNTQTQWLEMAKISGYERGYAEGQAYAQGYEAGSSGGEKKSLVERKVLSDAEQRKYNKEHGLPSGYRSMTDDERIDAYQNMSWMDKRRLGNQTGKVGKSGWKTNSWNGSKAGSIFSTVGSIVGGGLQAWGASAAEEDAEKGAWISAAGSAAQGLSAGAAFGPWGAAAGAIIGFLTAVPAIIEASNEVNKAKERLQKAEEQLKEANLDRAQKTEIARDLESTITNLKKLQESRYESEEANQAFIEASNAAAEKFPQLVSSYSSTGDAIIDVIGDVSRAERALIQARQDSADAALKAAAAEMGVEVGEYDVDKAEMGKQSEHINEFVDHWGKGILEYVITERNALYPENEFDESSLDDFWYNEGSLLMPQAHIARAATGDPTYGQKATAKERTHLDPETGTTVIGPLDWLYSIATEEGANSTTGLDVIKAIYGIDSDTYFSDQGIDTPEEQTDWLVDFWSSANTADIMQRVQDAGYEVSEESISALITYMQDWLVEQLIGYHLLSQKTDANGTLITTLADYTPFAKTQADASTSLNDVRASRQFIAQRYAAKYSTSQDPLYKGQWRQVTGADSIIANYAMGKAEVASDSFHLTGDKSGEFKTDTQSGLYTKALDFGYSIFENLTETQIEELDNLQRQALQGTISAPDYKKGIENIFGKGSEMAALFYQDFLTQRNDDILRTIEGISKHTDFSNKSYLNFTTGTFSDKRGQWRSATFTGLPDYDTWLIGDTSTDSDNIVDNEANRQVYDRWVSEQINNAAQEALANRDYLTYALLVGPLEQTNEYYKALEEETKIINDKNAPEGYKNTARKRLEAINTWYDAVGQRLMGTGLFKDVSDEGMNEFFTLLNQDRGTYEWAENLEKWAIQYGVDLGDIEALAFEVYEIRLQSIIDKTQIAVRSLEELKEKNTKGFTWDEANTLLAQIQKIDPSATFKSIFDVNEQGLIILKDFGKTADQLYQGSLHDLYEQQQHLGEIVDNFEGKDSTSDSHFILQQGNKTRVFANAVTPYLKALYGLIENTETTLEQDTQAAQDAARQINEQYGLNLSPEELASLTQAILDGKIQSYEDLVNFYTSLRDNAANAYDVFSKQSKSLIASIAFDNWVDGFTGTVNAKDMLSSGKKVSDLKDMWVKNFDSWNQKMFDSEEQALREQAIVWEESDFEALTDEQKAKLGVSNQKEFNNKYLNQVKNSDYWTTADYSQYYTYQSEALKAHGASLDAFGNLIITDWEKWGTYIAESYGFIENGVIKNQDAYDAVMAESKAAQLKATEDYANSIKSGFTSIAESFAEDGKIEFSELEGILAALQSQGLINGSQYKDIIDAYIEAKDKGPEAIKEVLQKIADYTYGTDVDLTGINEAYKDAVLSIAKSVFDNISSALEGTINATDLNSLAEQLGLPDLANFGLQTIDGFQLNAEGLLLVLDGVQKKYGNIYGTAEKMVERLVGDGKMYSGYQDIEAATEELLDTNGDIIAGYEEEYELLKRMAAVARGMADDARFDFMNQDQTSGMGDTWDTMVNNAKTARSALKTLNEEGSIDIREFQNMMAFIKSENQDDPFGAIGISAENARTSLKNWADSVDPKVLANLGYDSAEAFKTAVASIGSSTELYDFYINTIIAANGKLDGIDASAMANFGLQIGNISDGMSESIKKVAQDQITYLKGIRGMLEAMKALEDIGDISLGSFKIDGEMVDVTFDNYKFYLPKMSEKQKQDLSANFKNQFLGNKEGQFGIDENLFTLLFGEDGLDITSEADQAIISQFTALSNMTKEQWEQFVLTYPELVKDGKIDWNAVAQLVLDGFDPNNFIPYIDAKTVTDARANLQKAIEAAINDDDDDLELHLKYDSVTGEFIVPENGDANTAIAAVEKYYSEAGAFVEATVENGVIKIHYINPKVKTIIDNLNKEENTVEFDAAKGYTITTKLGDDQYFTYRIDPKNGTITDKEGKPFKPGDVPEALREKWASEGYEEVPTEIEGGETTVSYKINTETEGESNPLADIKATLDLIYGMFSSGQVLSLSFDNTSAEATQTVLDAILAAWDTLVKLDGSTVTLNVNQGGTAGPQTPTPDSTGTENTNQAQSQGGVVVPLTIDTEGFISQLATLYTSITNNTAGIEPPVIKVIAKWQEGSPDNLKTDVEGRTLTQKVRISYNGYKASFAEGEQIVKVHYKEDPPDEDPPNPNEGQAKGNVALARGNVSTLLAGAAFAHGTLMGELGPELYVQDGQYHIAGANGPEFVDLHSDAIVFNHLQTAKLLNKGHINSHGSPVTDERTAVAFATGNVSGPAHANSNIDDAIAAVDAAIAMWQNILNASINDMLNASGGGGGGGSDTIKAVTVELQEWYNLTRKIAEVEERINKLLAERENIEKRDGAAYLRNLREEQQYWREQLTYQTVLAQYQSAQLDRQREAIEQSEIWGQFFKFDSQGNIQFRNGNERGDGKGTLEFLQDLKSMGLEDQIKAIEKLGYSYTDADGNKLEGKDLVDQFLKDIDAQMKNYESLYDTVKQAETKIEQIKTNIEEVERQIKENQMDLEQDIYDTIVEAQEKVIDGLEEQKELIEEANKAYVDGLNNALKAEKDLYSKNESISDREQLQRQLSLLRRSGGSASEIAALEEQLNDMLKNEYFSNQEDMIKDIEEANKEQIRKLEEQIRLEEEALEYQKEHGLIWSQVADIMSHDSDYILDFLQGNSTDFFAQSALQQEQMLTEWAHKIGIYTEDRELQNYKDEEADMWEGDKPQIFDSMDGELGTGDKKTSYGDFFNTLSDENKKLVKDSYLQAYAKARQEGKTEEEARKIAQEEMKSTLGSFYDASLAPDNEPPSGQPDPGSGGSKTMYVTGGALNVREKPDKNSKKLGQLSNGTKVSILEKTNSDWYKIKSGNLTGYVMAKYLSANTTGNEGGSGGEGSDLTHWTFTFNGTKYSHYKSKASAESKIQSLADGLDAKWAKNVEDGVMTRSEYARRKTGLSTLIDNAKRTLASGKHSKGYSQGGIVDYTGTAIVHGTPSKPEAFLNAQQTAMISEAVKASGDGGALDGIKATLAALNSTIKGIVNNNTNTASSFTVAPGAVTIQVAELSDSYDVEELSKDVMNRIVAIASKSTNRGVNRR